MEYELKFFNKTYFHQILVVFTLLFISCRQTGRQTLTKDIDFSLVQKDDVFEQVRLEETFDTVYTNKNYKFVLTKFDEKMYSDDSREVFKHNTTFNFQKLENGKYVTLFSDSIACEMLEFSCSQFMDDSLPELLIRNNRDFRSNWTWYLYQIDTSGDSIRRIKNFEQIKNPGYLLENDLILGHALSGRNWTNFYKINADSVIDFDMIIYGGPTADSEIDNYDKDYNNALKKVLRKVKAMNLGVKK